MQFLLSTGRSCKIIQNRYNIKNETESEINALKWNASVMDSEM